MTREAWRSSTTFTGIPRASHRLAIQRFTARRDVATITSRAPSKSSAANSRMRTSIVPAAASCAELGRDLGRHHGDGRVGALEQLHLARGHRARPDHQHRLTLKIEEKRKIIHARYPSKSTGPCRVQFTPRSRAGYGADPNYRL